MKNAVSVREIVKSYGRVQALKGVSLDAREGEIFGMIGPDGAGKTSLFRILTTLLLPDSGTATIDGYEIRKDFKEIRRRVGYMPGRFSLYQDLTVEENLNFFATVFHTTVRENYALIADIYSQIEPFKKRKAGKLSGGMKQKLALSCALIHQPAVLFLDEPTTGVDPVSRKEFWQMLTQLKEQGITILVSTPYMDEAALCDRIALIQEGEFLETETPENMIRNYGEILWSVRSDNMFRLLNDLRKYPVTKSCFAFGEVHHITLNNSEKITPTELEAYLTDLGHKHIQIRTIRPTIEDCYMRLSETKSGK